MTEPAKYRLAFQGDDTVLLYRAPVSLSDAPIAEMHVDEAARHILAAGRLTALDEHAVAALVELMAAIRPYMPALGDPAQGVDQSRLASAVTDHSAQALASAQARRARRAARRISS